MFYHTRQCLTPVMSGTCPVCGVAHEPDMPHSLKSLFFQYSFYDEHGYAPTPEDACAHCSEKVKREYLSSVCDFKKNEKVVRQKVKRSSKGRVDKGNSEISSDDGQQHFL